MEKSKENVRVWVVFGISKPFEIIKDVYVTFDHDKAQRYAKVILTDPDKHVVFSPRYINEMSRREKELYNIELEKEIEFLKECGLEHEHLEKEFLEI